MEPVKAEINERFIIHTSVIAIEERKDHKYVSGFGPDTVFADVSRGYFVTLEGSYESLGVGMEKPDLRVGDKMKITIEKV